MRSALLKTDSHLSGDRFSFNGRCRAWLFSQRHFNLKLFSGTAAGVLVVALLAGSFFFVAFRQHREEALRNHTIATLRLSSALENDIAALETGHRGFLLTGKTSLLQPFEKRREGIKQRVNDLAALILDHPTQGQRVMKVQEIVERWLNTVAVPQMNARITATNARLTAASSPPAGSLALGNSIVDEARELLQSLENEEQARLHDSSRDQEFAARRQLVDGTDCRPGSPTCY